MDKDLELLRFYERKTGKILLLDTGETSTIRNYFPNIDRGEFLLIKDEFNLDKHPITSILELCEDKIFLCNIGVSATGSTLHFVTIFEMGLLFYSIEEKEMLVSNILSTLCHYISSTYHHPKFIKLCLIDDVMVRIYFDTSTLRKTKEELCGWNSKVGYFCSVVRSIEFICEYSHSKLLQVTPENDSVVGISYDRYIEFAKYRYTYNIPCDIFRLLCNLWLMVEVFIARSRLVKNIASG